MKAKGKSDADITQFLVSKGVFNSDGHATVADNGQVSAAPPPKESIFGKAADVVNEGYNAYKNLPVIKQATQAVGGVVGAAGGLIGGTIGAVANPIKNAIESKPLFEGEGKAIVDSAKSTAGFGYDIGKEGAAAAPLGAAGKAVNLAVAYGQGYQGAQDLYQGYKEGDAAKEFSGALSLGTAVVGAKGALSNHGVIVDPDVAAQVKELPETARKAAVQKAYIKTVDAYRQVMNMNKSDIAAESRSFKDTPKFLAEQGIIPEMDGSRKFAPDKSIQTLNERVAPLQQQLTQTLESDPKPMDLDVLESRAVAEVNKNKSIPAIDRKEQISSIQETIDAEKEANGGKPNKETGRVDGGNEMMSPDFNQTKSSFWNKSYNPAKTKVANSAVWQLGHEAKGMIEEAYKDQADIKGMNQQIGNYASAIRLLDNGLRGKVVPGGRLGNLIYKVVGATALSSLGPAGSLVGAEALGKVHNFLTSPSVKLGAYLKATDLLGGMAEGKPPAIESPGSTGAVAPPGAPAAPASPSAAPAASPEVSQILDKYSQDYAKIKDQYSSPPQQGAQGMPSGPMSQSTAPSPAAAPAAASAPVSVATPPDVSTPAEPPYVSPSKLKVSKSVIDTAKDLTPEDRKVETAAIEKTKAQEPQILQAYKDKYGKVVNTDNFRQFFKDEGYAGHNAAAVQEPASHLSKLAFAEGLKNEGEFATFFAGGSGSGKTSAIKNLPEVQAVLKDSAVVLDGNLSSYDSAVKKIQQATDAGKKVPIMYVFRDPVEAFNEGVVKRMKSNPDEGGRLVPTKVVAENHVGSWDTVKRLYEDGHDVTFIDNSNGKNGSKIVPFEEMQSKIKETDPKKLKKTLDASAKRLYKGGEITKEQLDGYLR